MKWLIVYFLIKYCNQKCSVLYFNRVFHLSNVSRTSNPFLNFCLLFHPRPPPTLLYSNFDPSLRCWQRIWLIPPYYTGFHHLPSNEANSTRRGCNIRILYANSNCDIGSLLDCLIACLIICGNSSTGLDLGGNAFWHATLTLIITQHLYRKYLTDTYMYPRDEMRSLRHVFTWETP